MAPKPIQFTEKEFGQIRVMAGLGLSIEKICLILGFSPATFYRRKKLIPEIKEAYESGTAKAEYTISKTLWEMAVNDKNLTAIIWWEKTRFGRNEKVEVGHSVEPETTQKVVVYIPDNGRDENIKLAKEPGS